MSEIPYKALEALDAEIITDEFKVPVLKNIVYPVTMESLEALVAEYSDIPEIDVNASDEVVSQQFEFVVQGHKKFVKAKRSIEKARKVLKAPALEYGKAVDSIAKEFQSKINHIEEKLLFQRKVVEDNEARKQREAEEAEERRVDAIKAEIASTKNLPLQHFNSSSSKITKVLESFRVITKEDFEEFYDEAIETQNFVISQLQTARDNKVLVENAQKLQDEAEEKARAEKELADRKIQDEKDAFEKEKAEFQKRKDEFDAQNRAYQEEIDREEAVKKADALQAQQEIENEEKKQKEKESFEKFKYETINDLCDVCLLTDETAEIVFDGIYGGYVNHLKFEM